MGTGLKTRVYHIVKFRDGSAYAFFSGCTWNCAYCVVRNVSRWCLSLERKTASALSYGLTLSLNEFFDILSNNNIHTVFLGGEEPTYDPLLFEILSGLKSMGIRPWLITNGERLTDRVFSLSYGITFSIKAVTPSLHLALTGKDNARPLSNFKKYADPSKVVAETVLFPGLVDCDEAVRVARFVEYVNPRIKLRVDLAVQAKQKVEYLKECIGFLKSAHWNTYYFEPSKSIEEPEVLFPSVDPKFKSFLNDRNK